MPLDLGLLKPRQHRFQLDGVVAVSGFGRTPRFREVLGVGEVRRLVRGLEGRRDDRPARGAEARDEGARPSRSRNRSQCPAGSAEQAPGRRAGTDRRAYAARGAPEDETRGEDADREHDRDQQVGDPGAARRAIDAHVARDRRRERQPRVWARAQVFHPQHGPRAAAARRHRRAVDLDGFDRAPERHADARIFDGLGQALDGDGDRFVDPHPGPRSPSLTTVAPDSTFSATLGPMLADSDTRIASVPAGRSRRPGRRFRSRW